MVPDFYERLFNRHEVAAAAVIAENYVQHNPQVPDAKAPFVDYFAAYFEQNPQYRNTIVRSAVDKDLVYAHVHSTNTPTDRGQAVVDIFRVADGKIVEHWDVIQDVPSSSANSNTMMGGGGHRRGVDVDLQQALESGAAFTVDFEVLVAGEQLDDGPVRGTDVVVDRGGLRVNVSGEHEEDILERNHQALIDLVAGAGP